MKGGMEHQNKQSLSELMFSEPMKRATKLLVSVSVFSIVFTYMSWRSHPILAFPIQLLSHALDKNYMFLICNGILVLLAKTSGRVVRSGPGYDLNDDLHAPPPHAKLLEFSLLHKEALVESRLVLLENADSDDDRDDDDDEVEEEEEYVIKEEKEAREDDDSRSLMISSENPQISDHPNVVRNRGFSVRNQSSDHFFYQNRDPQNTLSMVMIEGDKQEEEDDDGFLKVAGLMEEDCRSCNMEGDDDDDELEELNNGVFVEAEIEVAEERERLNKLSAEELNKKFEEFIRKMKEDIRMEAQQQHLVLVK